MTELGLWGSPGLRLALDLLWFWMSNGDPGTSPFLECCRAGLVWGCQRLVPQLGWRVLRGSNSWSGLPGRMELRYGPLCVGREGGGGEELEQEEKEEEKEQEGEGETGGG